MATSFPTSLQDLDTTRGNAGQKLSSPNHADHHKLEDETIEALETKVGADGSANTSSHDFKLSGVATGDKAVSKTGTETLTNKTLTSPVLNTPKINVGSDAEGDIYYRDASGNLARLEAVEGKILKIVDGVPVWETETTIENASDTVKGVVEIATAAEIATGTTSGGTGARLVVPADSVVRNIFQFNAGETISGATSPVPVCQNPSDGEIYSCDANDVSVSYRLNFIGFAITSSTDGNSIIVQTSGIVSGFSGLSVGTRYYVQDTVGTIGTSKGTYVISVGIAISSSQILIEKERLAYKTIASDTLIQSDDAAKVTANQTMTKLKEIFIKAPYGLDGIRVKFQLGAQNGDNKTMYGQIYKNGSAVGTLRSASSTKTTFSEDFTIPWHSGDLLQVYGYSNDGGIYNCEVANLRIYYDKQYNDNSFSNQDPT